MRASLLTLSLVITLASAQEEYSDLDDGSEPAQKASPMDPLSAMMGGKGGPELDKLKEMFGDKTKMAETMKTMMQDGTLKKAMAGMGDQMKQAMNDPHFSNVMKHSAKQVHHMQKHMKKAGINDEGAADMNPDAMKGMMEKMGANPDAMKEMMEKMGANPDAMKALGGLGNPDAMKEMMKNHPMGAIADLMKDESMKETMEEMTSHLKEVMADGSFKDVIDQFGSHMHAAKVDDQKGSLASLLTSSSKRSEM
jgi:hypothetical protein